MDLDSIKQEIVEAGYFINDGGKVEKDEDIVLFDYTEKWLTEAAELNSFYEVTTAIETIDVDIAELIRDIKENQYLEILYDVDDSGEFSTNITTPSILAVVEFLNYFNVSGGIKVSVQIDNDVVKIKAKNKDLTGYGGFDSLSVVIKKGRKTNLKDIETNERSW